MLSGQQKTKHSCVEIMLVGPLSRHLPDTSTASQSQAQHGLCSGFSPTSKTLLGPTHPQRPTAGPTHSLTPVLTNPCLPLWLAQSHRAWRGILRTSDITKRNLVIFPLSLMSRWNLRPSWQLLSLSKWHQDQSPFPWKDTFEDEENVTMYRCNYFKPLYLETLLSLSLHFYQYLKWDKRIVIWWHDLPMTSAPGKVINGVQTVLPTTTTMTSSWLCLWSLTGSWGPQPWAKPSGTAFKAPQLFTHLKIPLPAEAWRKGR